MSTHVEADTPIPPQDANESASRPTHRLDGIKVGENSVQLLVSTKDHLYDAKDVGAADNSYQVIGSWEDSSVQELTKILNQRQVITTRQASGYSGSSRFAATHGAGQTLNGTRQE
jgi:hypothetical protein